jgi:hypothetical protein
MPKNLITFKSVLSDKTNVQESTKLPIRKERFKQSETKTIRQLTTKDTKNKDQSSENLKINSRLGAQPPKCADEISPFRPSKSPVPLKKTSLFYSLSNEPKKSLNPPTNETKIKEKANKAAPKTVRNQLDMLLKGIDVIEASNNTSRQKKDEKHDIKINTHDEKKFKALRSLGFIVSDPLEPTDTVDELTEI